MIPIYYEHFEVGQLQIDGREVSFSYHPRWLDTQGAFPLSLSMPKSEATYTPDVCLPWLINLLPEEQNLVTIGRNLGISPQDTFGMLEHIGRDLAGAVSIGEPRIRETADYRVVETSGDLERIMNELPSKPFLAGEEGVSMSLAGVQEKLPVAVMDGQITIPTNGAPSTHILKPDSERLFGSIQNEALCLRLARLCGLDAAGVTTGIAGNRSYLLVERYDRMETKRGIRRIHQEDFCQALAIPPAAKYERNRTGISGPKIVDLFGVVDKHMTAADTNKLLNAIIFNVIICNTDSHAKNYSVLLSNGEIRLAPLYDLMCGAAWQGVTKNMSQLIAGQNRGDHIHGRHWKRLASDCGISETMIITRIEELIDQVQSNIGQAQQDVTDMPAGDHPMLPHFVEAIQARCRTLSVNLKT